MAKTSLFRAVRAIGVIWVASVSAGLAQVASPDVSNSFFQSDLRQALEDLSAQSNVNIIVDPTVQGIVSVTIEDKPLDEAIQLMLSGTEYRVEARDDHYLVFTPDVETDLFTELSETVLVRVTTVEPEAAIALLPDSLQRYARPDRANGRVAVTAPTDILNRVVAELDAIDSRGEDTVFLALNNISALAARDLLPTRLQGFVRVDEGRNTVSVTAPVDTRTEIVGLLRRSDRPLEPRAVDNRDIYPTRIVKLENVTAALTTNLLPEALLQYVRADDATNTLSVSAPPAIGNKILQDIHSIDRPRQHIMLEARIVVLESNNLLDFGTDFEFPTVSAGFSDTNGDYFSEVRVGYSPDREFTNALSVTLNLLSANDEATIVSSPKVLAQDGLPSQIRVTTEEYFQIVTEDSVFVRSELEQIETGTVLNITPQVGRNGTVTLNMELEVSDVVARGAQNLPVVSRRTAQNSVQIESGGTAAIAGLVDTRTQTTRSGIPGANQATVFGRLFRSDNLNHEAQQVAIFVTARVVDDGDTTFRTGNPTPPNLGRVDEELFRAELLQSLNRLEAN